MSNKIPYIKMANGRRKRSLLGGSFETKSRVQMEATHKMAEYQ